MNNTKQNTYGFIITRHVISKLTNKYWNNCIICIRRFYPTHKIIIIDDNSNTNFVKADFDYKNIEIIYTKYKKRGELLPYYYFFKNKYFDYAVIIHDSVFFNKKIVFENIKLPILPLWHFEYVENIDNCLRISKYLNYSNYIQEQLIKSTSIDFGFINYDKWVGCFGIQSYISHKFISHIERKYNLFNLLNVINCRNDRCSLERIMGVIFYTECKNLYPTKSLLGDIWKYSKWGLTYNEYENNKYDNNKPLIKVWTGR